MKRWILVRILGSAVCDYITADPYTFQQNSAYEPFQSFSEAALANWSARNVCSRSAIRELFKILQHSQFNALELNSADALWSFFDNFGTVGSSVSTDGGILVHRKRQDVVRMLLLNPGLGNMMTYGREPTFTSVGDWHTGTKFVQDVKYQTTCVILPSNYLCYIDDTVLLTNSNESALVTRFTHDGSGRYGCWYLLQTTLESKWSPVSAISSIDLRMYVMI
jgi:hypothetical protein